MSLSLREQLLAAGLATQKQSKDAERHLRQQQRQRQQLPKSKRGGASESERAAEQARHTKAARDQDLSRRQTEAANEKASQAQVAQLVEHNRLPRAQTDEFYNFVDGNKIRRIPADAAVRARIGHGEIAIIRCNGRYELVPADTAARIRERDPHAVIMGGPVDDQASTDDETYRGFVVPDDLVW